jgi:hypothetical protein
MLNRKISRTLTAGIIATMPFVATDAAAKGGIDGSRDVVCAVIKVVGCMEGNTSSSCIEGSAKSFDLPELMILDTKKKVMKATYESGHNEVSPIKTLEHSGNHMIMQGIENSHGWSIAIDTKTGTMSGSAVGEDVSFLVFGTCTAL